MLRRQKVVSAGLRIARLDTDLLFEQDEANAAGQPEPSICQATSDCLGQLAHDLVSQERVIRHRLAEHVARDG